MGFSEQLKEDCAGIWQAQLEHPVVRGIADGTLPVEMFRRWIRQDYLFLIEYCRLLALAAARAPDLETIARFADLLHSTAGTEMDLHRAYAAEFDVSSADLDREAMAPTTRAYTDFLLRTAAIGDFAELAAALLPCMWAFSDIGQSLAGERSAISNPYSAWVDMYASAEFGELAVWCRDLVDRLAEKAGNSMRNQMRAAFETSSRYELAFWEMVCEGERRADL